MPTVRVKPKTYERLKDRGRAGDSLDDVIQKALDELDEWESRDIHSSKQVGT